MPLLSLPNEVLLLVADHLGNDAKALASFIDTNCRLANLLTSHLNNIALHTDHGNINGEDVIIYAAKSGNKRLARLALEKRPETPMHVLRATLQLAASTENTSEAIIKLLLEKGADVMAVSSRGWTPLHSAAHRGRQLAVRLLLESGADPNTPQYMSKNSATPLFRAVEGKEEVVVKLLLEYGADIPTSGLSDMGATVLYAATKTPGIVKLLLKQGADIATKAARGDTALHWAAKDYQEKAIRMLLEGGADIEARNRQEETPLHIAVKGKWLTATKILLEYGADVGARRKGAIGYTAIHLTARKGSSEIFGNLLDYGADINTKTNFGQTALHLAIISQKGRMVRYLLEKESISTFRMFRERLLFTWLHPWQITGIMGRSNYY